MLVEEPQKTKMVCDDETMKFVKTLRRSEYLVVGQLKNLAAQISIPSLQISLEAHWNALLKVLNKPHVLEAIAMKDLEHIIKHIVETNTISFNEDELSPEGSRHVK